MRYRMESVGRMAIFLLPYAKTKATDPIHIKIHNFLSKKFTGYTVVEKNITGYWKTRTGQWIREPQNEFEVSFVGKERIPQLAEFLAKIAEELKQDCIYLKTGEDSWLLYPDCSNTSEPPVEC